MIFLSENIYITIDNVKFILDSYFLQLFWFIPNKHVGV